MKQTVNYLCRLLLKNYIWSEQRVKERCHDTNTPASQQNR